MVQAEEGRSGMALGVAGTFAMVLELDRSFALALAKVGGAPAAAPG
jgi:hypothetical protein